MYGHTVNVPSSMLGSASFSGEFDCKMNTLRKNVPLNVSQTSLGVCKTHKLGLIAFTWYCYFYLFRLFFFLRSILSEDSSLPYSGIFDDLSAFI